MRYLFLALSQNSRIRIVLHLLSEKEETPVSDVVAAVGLSFPTVSRQLRELLYMGLVKNRRDGKNVKYSIADGRIEQILRSVLELAAERK